MDTRLGKKLPTAEQARYADHCDDAEFDLVPISMARDARIGQAQRRFGRLSILKHDGFIGDAAVTGSALQRTPKRVGRCHDVIQQSEISTVELFGETKAKEIVVKHFGGDFKKSDLACRRRCVVRDHRSDRWLIQRAIKAAPI